MSPRMTDEDVGKTVVSPEGERLGVVAAVDGETAYVELEAGIESSIDAVLDWRERDDVVAALPSDAADRITDDAVYIDAGTLEELSNGATTPVEQGARPGEPTDRDATDPATADRTAAGGNEEPTETAEPGVTDVAEEIDGTDERRGGESIDGEETDPIGEIDETGGFEQSGPEVDEDDTRETGEEERLDDVASVESAASREVEVDPSEVTDGDPVAEIDPEEDLRRRSGDDAEPAAARDEEPDEEGDRD